MPGEHLSLAAQRQARAVLGQVAIVGAHNTIQARNLPEESSLSIVASAIFGALNDAGLRPSQVDGLLVDVMDPSIRSSYLIPLLGGQECWTGSFSTGINSILQGAAAIAAGLCDVVVVAAGQAGLYKNRESTAPWTVSVNKYVEAFGVYTAVDYALLARRHMHLFGTTREQMAEVAATIRNHGHINPDAVYFGRGPFSAEDVLGSRPICEPFNLLDCSTTTEGGSAIVLARRDRLVDLKTEPVFILGGGVDAVALAYTRPALWEKAGMIGHRAAQRTFQVAGLNRRDVDVCEFYDPFSWEVIRQFEAFGFCEQGEGGAFVAGGRIRLDGEYPTSTDGGLLSFSHPGAAQMLQKSIQAVRQLRGSAGASQVDGAEVALVSNVGSGSLVCDVMLLGKGTSS